MFSANKNVKLNMYISYKIHQPNINSFSERKLSSEKVLKILILNRV
jgi:hypothetical protein